MKLMRRLLGAALALCSAAFGHFGFVVPQAGGRSAELIISEELKADGNVSVDVIKEVKLNVRDSEGKISPLTLVRADKVFRMEVPGRGKRILYGVADLGISPGARGPKPYLLLYYPKTLLGPILGEQAKLGRDVAVELVPYGEAGKISFQLLSRGQALAESEVTVIQPDGTQKKVKTDAKGMTPEFSQTGRFGAWARFWEEGSGERDGKKYEQVRHYAMLVCDVYAKASQLTVLPEATSSFGAVADKGWVYVYGGHISPTHSYSTAAVSGKFNRYQIGGKEWESLPAGPALQGMNLAAHEGKIYRVGGMEPRNAPGTKESIYSIANVARFEPTTKVWEEMPALPEPRSSHDVAVIGSKLIVAGGWILKGAQGSSWANTTVMLDLSLPGAKWESTSQPFERRALISAVHKGRMYVMGGITKAGAVSGEVDIFDPKTGSWSKGPALPGTQTNNFAPAACEYRGELFVSLADGTLYRLNESSGRWEDAGMASSRLAHRMVPGNDGLLILGGAEKGKNLNLVEFVPVSSGGKGN